MEIQTELFIVFSIVVVGFLIVDLGYFNRKAHRIGTKSALIQSIFWIAISFAFAFLILKFMGREAAAQFMSAYVTEKMLSVDNLFVIMLIFNFFNIEEKYHHKVLFWGIMGAVVFRGLFITIGAYIIEQFHWVLYIFGAMLVYTGIKLFNDKKEEHVDFEKNKVVRFARKYLPFTANYHNGNFIVKESGKIYFTSNIFAFMVLRALFFLLENVLHKFHHLQKGLSFILIFVGAKMFLGIFDFHISSLMSFAIIMTALGISLLLSVVFPKKI